MKPFKAEHEQKLWQMINQLVRDIWPEEQRIDPLLFALNQQPDAQLRVIPLTGLQKHHVASVRDAILAEGYTVCTLWEALTYFATVKDQELDAAGLLVLAPPSQHPDRVEVVQMTLHSVAEPGRITTQYARIVRDGDKATLGEWNLFDSADPGNAVQNVSFGNQRIAAGGKQ